MRGMQQFSRRIIRKSSYPSIFRAAIPLSFPREIVQPCFTTHRAFVNIHPALLPPLVFSGLVLALWTWKCVMMVLFQNKIIYMPGLPPNARREKISDYLNQCRGITWREEKIVTADRTQIALAVARIQGVTNKLEPKNSFPIYIVYFQGQYFPPAPIGPKTA
jgi:hypothetical protein